MRRHIDSNRIGALAWHTARCVHQLHNTVDIAEYFVIILKIFEISLLATGALRLAQSTLCLCELIRRAYHTDAFTARPVSTSSQNTEDNTLNAGLSRHRLFYARNEPYNTHYFSGRAAAYLARVIL